jgi:hypothetical protein
MVETVFDIYTDTLKYFNPDVFNIPFKYYFNSVISDSAEHQYNSYDIMNYMHLFYIIISTILAIFVGYIYYYYEPKFDSDGNEIIYDSDTENNLQKESNSKPLVGIYTDSIKEIIKMNDIILDKMLESKNEKTMYWILLRVQMRHPLDMNKTKFELHGNHTGDSNANKFTTKDAFMLMKFIYYKGKDSTINKRKITKNIGSIIINFMNYYNTYAEEKYKTNDFIIVAISQIEDNTNPKEFYSGLISNEYEMNNYHDVMVTVPRTNFRSGYVLTLPIHQVYDIFLDVFPNVIFETKDYEMDNNNFESWKGMSMNELSF